MLNEITTSADRTTHAEVRRLFDSYPYKDGQLRALGIPKEQMVSYLCKTLEEQGVHLIDEHDGRLRGLVFLASAPGKSALLGTRIWAIRHLVMTPDAGLPATTRLVQRALKQVDGRADFIECRVDACDLTTQQALQQARFHVVGGELACVVSTPSRLEAYDQGIRIEPLSANRVEAVAAIARQAHLHNHYAYDSRFAREQVAEVYAQEVIRSSRNESPATRVLVAVDEDDVSQGFIIYRFQPRLAKHLGRPLANLDFIGVRPGDQRRGIGDLLNRAALAELKDKGASMAIVRTMISNYPALGVLRKLDMKITSANMVLHQWLD